MSTTTCNLCASPIRGDHPPRWRKDGFEVVECPGCGLIFRRELPTREDLSEIYRGEYFRRPDAGGDAQGYLDYLADADVHRLAARKRLRRLERHVAPGRLLDVGAAAGFFMAEARKRAWRVEGIDVAPAMTQWGRERLGLLLDTGVFEDSEYRPDSYDLVTMWDYIEHAIDPTASFDRAYAVLRPGGVLALSTGDAASLLARLSGSRWHLLTPRHHNFYFTGYTLDRYLVRAGFEVLEQRHPSAPYSVRYLAHKLGTFAPKSRLWRRATDRVAESRLGRLPVSANLWDVVTIVARKPGGAGRRA
jgi:2-polyprenyl-3-methyl-5-hydroxy-6-metoxy-1,4-benzoquinol methylase